MTTDHTHHGRAPFIAGAALILLFCRPGLSASGVVDPTTLDKKVLLGYQGWFTCPQDGSQRWTHWSRGVPTPETLTVDLYPDVSELDPDERCEIPGMTIGGKPAYLFSSRNPKTVSRHFRWMKEYGLDGVLVQRFVGTIRNKRAEGDTVLKNIMAAAKESGRTFAIEYDISGGRPETFAQIIQEDWAYLVDELKVTSHPNYQHHDGKPVVSVWGMGLDEPGHPPNDPQAAKDLIEWFKSRAPGNCRATYMGGTPSRWRTLTNDSHKEPEWAGVFAMMDVVQPWTVGRYRTLEAADEWKENMLVPDLELAKANRQIYMPVIFPGFSWHNLKKNAKENQIPRLRGEFLWRQAYNARMAGATVLKIAMFDELDEGTAVMKVASRRSEAPDQGFWLTLDADGAELPSDWYLRLAGEITRMFHGEIEPRAQMPANPGPQSKSAVSVKKPVDYVNPNIGTIGHLLTATVPYVQYPHGMARIAPITTPGIQDRYVADQIFGFPAGPATLMAYTGEVTADPAKSASLYDHDFETATPYWYKVRLDDSEIWAEATAARTAAYYRFTFPAASNAHLSLHLRRGVIEVIGPASVSGSGGGGRDEGEGVRFYFYAEFSKPIAGYRTWKENVFSKSAKQSGGNVGFASEFAAAAGERIGVRVGISYISAEQARKNLWREIPEWNFDAVKAQTRAEWNRALGKIEVKGGTERERTIFYTALYRTLGRMTNITEDGRYYSGYDQSVHAADGHDFYVDDGLWDTYRSAHPLSLLIEPREQVDMVRSYIRMYEQSGWMPSFPSVGGERAVMIGHHSTAFISDVYMKGYRDFDVEKAYAGMKKNAMQGTMLPWRRGPLTELDKVYLERGFFPALAKGETEPVKEVHPFERRQSVAVTLENCYDDWALAQVAKGLGKEEDYAYFMKRARNYANLYDERIGFMAPKSADGKWVEGFDPKLGGGQGGRAWFAECDSWVYTWHVQHDPAGLMSLMGGPEKFAARLDQLFREQYGVSKFTFLGQFPDMTGLIGLYPQGNEPAFHIPYLYNYCGQPWKTQRRVRQIMDVWYGDGPLGICGDEDGGAMSSWFVFSAMGFYPVTPGQPAYEIGSPLFEETRITLDDGKVFTIAARNVSARNKYIQSATLNGKAWDKPWFTHSDLAAGGTLVLVMGPSPNPRWGSAPEAAPPSMSR